jgi:pimeloyl-ACP methyl ester carboxylesterase/predicted glycosyltransferase
MRAREPESSGYVDRDGVRIHYEVHGSGEQTILLMPTWSIIHARHWKGQVPYLARHFRVVVLEGRGNGKSDRPLDSAAYSEEQFAGDALAVLDATGTGAALVVAFSMGALRSLILTERHPERVAGLVFIGPSIALAPLHPERCVHPFNQPLETDEEWAKFNAHYWRRDFKGFAEFFFSRVFTEPHSTKPIDDCVDWSQETSAEILITAHASPGFPDRERALELCAAVRCPVLVIHGDEDAVSPHERGRLLAEATSGTLVTLEGSGHAPHARDPVRVNLLLREFAQRIWPSSRPPRRWRRARRRDRRALFVSSPIGLGHAQRDVAIARELRRIAPDLQIDWLAQHPVTRVLEAEGERIHPASRFLASESAHFESESAEHDLHCFRAWRAMDEILVANFMLFHDVVRDEPYDLWIGDEAWELDYYLHENPEEKRAPYVWLTDFVGWLPMEDGGAREVFLTADYNAEMIAHIARYPHLRDRALFVGDPEDVVPDRFGPDLPLIREWTGRHYDFPGYITGFDAVALADRERLRQELGYRPDERVCIVTVGGSGVGHHLLRRVIASFAAAERRVPGLRMIVVAGPRIDTASLPSAPGLEVHPYVHHLYRHLAACDLAIVQGGLTTSMELTANGRPFLYFPLRHHFEQNFHVRHRLQRYGAGRCMDYETATPDAIADAIAEEIGRSPSYRPVTADGARRAAGLIAELL